MNWKTILTTALFAAFVSAPLAAAGASAKENVASGNKGAARGASNAVFDLSHSEIFSPLDDGPLHYSAFYNEFRKSGAKVSVNKERITDKALKNVKSYVIAGPARDISPDETTALKKFVKNGGNVLVLLHISQPVARLTEQFGIILSNFVVSEPQDNIEGQSQDFYVSRLEPHPVTEGVKKIAVHGTWGLLAEKDAKTIASTSDKAWADLNRNRKFDHGEPVQSFGIIAVAAYGKGKVAVVADDAPFANKFITEADNTALADNIIKWFK